MSSSTPDMPSSAFDTLPKPVQHLLFVSAERAIAIANERLHGLLAGPALTPAAAAEWHDKVLTESTGPLVAAWATLEETDLRRAGLLAFYVLLDRQLRWGATGIAVLRQNGQLPTLLPVALPPSPAPPAPGAE